MGVRFLYVISRPGQIIENKVSIDEFTCCQDSPDVAARFSHNIHVNNPDVRTFRFFLSPLYTAMIITVFVPGIHINYRLYLSIFI